MRNDYASHMPSVNMPATGSFVVTPGVAFPQTPIRQITIGVAGTLSWKDPQGVVQQTEELPPGSYPLMATSIEAAGTTATKLTGWY